MEVQIIIKAPNQNIGDHTVNCNLDWTVENVKEHLSKAYPKKPKVAEQKLIYSGHLLFNHLKLKDILRHEDSHSSVHILHLVCSSDSSFQQPSQAWGHPSRHSPVSTNTAPGQSTANNVRQRNGTSVPPTNTFYPQFPQNLVPQPTMPVFVPDSQMVAQIAAMQQMYAYYFSQYMQSMNRDVVPAIVPAYPGFPNYQPPANNAPAQNEPPFQAAQLPEEMEEFLNRDWLDHVFQCARFVILFMLVFFYSTPERLMIVLVFAAVAFLYQEGWFMRRVVTPAPQEVVPPQEIPNTENLPDLEHTDEEPLLVNPDFSANDDSFGEYELEAAMDGDDPPHAQSSHGDANNHIFSPYNFLTSFFSSLIPDPPPPININ